MPTLTALDYLVRLYFEVIIDRNDAKALKRIGEGKRNCFKGLGFHINKMSGVLSI